MERNLNASTSLHPYATLAYAKTLSHIGRPVYVPAWQTYVFARDWQGRAEDVVGPYPLACLGAGSDLGAGLETLRKAGFVTATLVVDGEFGPSLEELKAAFDVAWPFKTHYLVDPNREYRPSKHHRYEIRRAERHGIEIRTAPLRAILDGWNGLYGELIARHRIAGVQRFTLDSFKLLAACEGLTAVAAYLDSELAACHLWFQYQGRVWSHLAASTARGYASGAAYAVYDHSIRKFADNLINLGGSAGLGDAGSHGLAHFKAGFCNRTATAHLLGSVLAPSTYQALCAECGGLGIHDYFPAYRARSTSEGGGNFPKSSGDKPVPCKSQPTISR